MNLWGCHFCPKHSTTEFYSHTQPEMLLAKPASILSLRSKWWTGNNTENYVRVYYEMWQHNSFWNMQIYAADEYKLNVQSEIVVDDARAVYIALISAGESWDMGTFLIDWFSVSVSIWSELFIILVPNRIGYRIIYHQRRNMKSILVNANAVTF